MPFTFAHPAAILPLRRYCPSLLNFPALFIGSMTPDAGYYLHNWQWAMLGHSFVGSLTFDVPAGLAFLGVFYLCLRPISALVPPPHRQIILSWLPSRKLPGAFQILVAICSIVLGSWTHIIWDGFTHTNGWCVRNLAALTPTVFSIGSYPVTVWQLLQHASTIFGLFVLWRAYSAQAAKFPPPANNIVRHPSERLALATVLILPAVFALAYASVAFRSGISMNNLASFTYTSAVTYVDYLFPSLICAGILASVYRLLLRRRQAKANNDAAKAPLAPTRALVSSMSETLPSIAAQPPPVPLQSAQNPLALPADTGNFTSTSVN